VCFILASVFLGPSVYYLKKKEKEKKKRKKLPLPIPYFSHPIFQKVSYGSSEKSRRSGVENFY
jgi:hypothetical protein